MNSPPYGDYFRRVNNFYSTLKVEPTPEPSMRLNVSSGGFWAGKRYVEFKGGLSPVFQAPTVNVKFDLLTINHNGSLIIIEGQQSTNPVVPDCLPNHLPLAVVQLKRSDEKITSDCIFDVRPGFGIDIIQHSDLIGNDLPDCHSIDSITDLRSTLANMPTNDEIRNVLREKSDIDGTSSVLFTLNKDYVGVPLSDVSIVVDRGQEPNVFFRWNESLHCWEYTNDGSVTVQLTSVKSCAIV